MKEQWFIKTIFLKKWKDTNFRYCLLVICTWNYVFAPQNYGAMQTLPPQNHRAFILSLVKLWSNAEFATQNHGDIVSDAKKAKKNILKLGFLFFFLIFCHQSMVSQRSFQPLGSLFKENKLCVTAPLSYEIVNFLPTTTSSSLKISLLRRLLGRPFPTQLHQ